jgi:hypothetical protein
MSGHRKLEPEKMNARPDPHYRIAGRLPIPAGLLDLRDPAQFRQGVALAVCLLSSSAFMVLLSVLAIPLSLWLDWRFHTERIALAGITLVLLCQLALFYYHASIRVTAMLLTTTYFLVTLAVVVVSGGYESPISFLLLCAIVVSFRFGTREDGFMSCIYVGGAVLSLVMLHMLDVPPVQMLHGLPPPSIFFIGWFSTLLTIVACLGTYTYDRDD